MTGIHPTQIEPYYLNDQSVLGFGYKNIISEVGEETPQFLLLEPGTTDKLLLESGDGLLLE